MGITVSRSLEPETLRKRGRDEAGRSDAPDEDQGPLDGAPVRTEAAAAEAGRKRQRCHTDLSDRSIQLCTQDAILAIHQRAVGLGIVDEHTSTYDLLAGSDLAAFAPRPAEPPAAPTAPGTFSPLSAAAAGVAASFRSLVGGVRSMQPVPRRTDGGSPSSAGRPATGFDRSVASSPPVSLPTAHPPRTAILDAPTQRALYRILHPSITAMIHEAALRRHSSAQACGFGDVLRVSELAQRIFILMPLRSRGPFALACRDTAEVARLCWSSHEFTHVDPAAFRLLRSVGSPVAQLTAWVRSTQSKPVFFLLLLADNGRLEQLRIGFRRSERGEQSWRLQVPEVEQTKGWRLDEAAAATAGLGSQFVVTKHHAYCVAAVQGQALLVKLGGQTSGTHEAPYRNRFPEQVTAMAMCPQDNNIIAFGVPRARGPSPSQLEATDAAGTGVVPDPADALDGGNAESPAGDTPPAAATEPSSRSPGVPEARHTSRIEVINFAASSRLQSLPTAHATPLLALDYSPDSSRILSCSSDAIQIWATASMHACPVPLRTLSVPEPSRIVLSRVHPTWDSLFLATNESIELRELGTAADAPRRSAAVSEADGPLLSLRWRRDNMQVTAAAFVSNGSMLCVSDRGDRLLFFTTRRPAPVKVCTLPWLRWGQAVPSLTEPLLEGDSPRAEGSAGASYDALPPRDVRLADPHGRVCIITAITECPDIRSATAAAATEPMVGTHLAVASSYGEVALVSFA